MISTIRVAKHDDLQVCDSIFSKLAIFWVVMGLSENFTVRPRKCRFMISTLRLDENNDSVAKAIIDTTADTSRGEGQDTWQHTRQCQGRGTGRHPGWHLAINWSIWRPRHWSTPVKHRNPLTITTQIMANFQNTDTFLNYCSQLVLWCLSYTDIFELLQWNFHLTLLQLKR